MSKEKDFKSITIVFKKSNEDVKEKIMDICNQTGRSKIDIVCDAIRQYDPNKINNNESNEINRQEIEKIVKEILGGVLLNNMASNMNPYFNNISQFEVQTNEIKTEEERLKQLNSKKLDLNLLGDDD
ncbi:hypothetical protein [Clostridium sporogenes]|uniref:hypothetical protein n=1 Tax=Clostridium sporogenes TaxID=1509 RepID=UPI00071789D5|nr:hypothetical protein [Clostridium sporogenes]KRU40011.1 hypothetical protein VT94_24880 [Clostridium sporogenes]MBY7065172.1 hypothetical protein [Clostridium sporogenes]MBY7071858.1 hypothetical protein [Clostridium sporogenes]MCW6064758.1 hypothetical protein [Clostridium sporogenes]OQP88515.1 hypothetical protein VT93_0201590 [Clostridium sporogenes]